MRGLTVILLVLVIVMGYRLLFADGSLAEQRDLERRVEEQSRVNAQLKARNAVLERDIAELKSGNRGLEQRAREQLGLVREGETFYQIVDEPSNRAVPSLRSHPTPGHSQAERSAITP